MLAVHQHVTFTCDLYYSLRGDLAAGLSSDPFSNMFEKRIYGNYK